MHTKAALKQGECDGRNQPQCPGKGYMIVHNQSQHAAKEHGTGTVCPSIQEGTCLTKDVYLTVPLWVCSKVTQTDPEPKSHTGISDDVSATQEPD